MNGPALVTGGSGWLGRRLVRALAHGLDDLPGLTVPERPVRCLTVGAADHAVIAGENVHAECVDGDLRDARSLDALFDGARDATVFHCAGIIHPRRAKDFTEINANGTRALLEAAARGGARRFVYVSSNSPIGCNPHPGHRFDEESPYDPYMGYGRSKMAAEQHVAVASARGDFETVVIRPPWFYGPGQPPRQTTFFTMIKNGKMPLVGGGENIRSMAYVDNIVQGLLLCERVEAAAGRTYWIADRHAHTMNEIVETVASVLRDNFSMDVAEKQMTLPGALSEVALLADKLIQGVGLYEQRVHVLSEMNKNIACTIDRAVRELGYDPRIALREGMRRSVQALLDDGGTI